MGPPPVNRHKPFSAPRSAGSQRSSPSLLGIHEEIKKRFPQHPPPAPPDYAAARSRKLGNEDAAVREAGMGGFHLCDASSHIYIDGADHRGDGGGVAVVHLDDAKYYLIGLLNPADGDRATGCLPSSWSDTRTLEPRNATDPTPMHAPPAHAHAAAPGSAGAAQ